MKLYRKVFEKSDLSANPPGTSTKRAKKQITDEFNRFLTQLLY